MVTDICIYFVGFPLQKFFVVDETGALLRPQMVKCFGQGHTTSKWQTTLYHLSVLYVSYNTCRHTSFYCASLYCASQMWCFFYKLKARAFTNKKIRMHYVVILALLWWSKPAVSPRYACMTLLMPPDGHSSKVPPGRAPSAGASWLLL